MGSETIIIMYEAWSPRLRPPSVPEPPPLRSSARGAAPGTCRCIFSAAAKGEGVKPVYPFDAIFNCLLGYADDSRCREAR